VPENYESGGQRFESVRARQYLATTFRSKNTAILRNFARNRVRANFAADAVVHRAVFGATAPHAETHRERRQDCYPDLSYYL